LGSFRRRQSRSETDPAQGRPGTHTRLAHRPDNLSYFYLVPFLPKSKKRRGREAPISGLIAVVGHASGGCPAPVEGKMADPKAVEQEPSKILRFRGLNADNLAGLVEIVAEFGGKILK
jgi:hypothetical protein